MSLCIECREVTVGANAAICHECEERLQRIADRDSKLTAIEEIVKAYTMCRRPWVTAEEYMKNIADLLGVK